jgi:hypothetical protein
MLPSRAGLKKPFSLRANIYSSPLNMRVAATLLFIISSLAVAIRAVPVLYPTTTTMSFSVFDNLEHCVTGADGAMGCISPGDAYNTAQSNLKSNSPYPGLPRALAPAYISKQPPGLIRRDEVETVVLVRRKSIAAKIRDAFHVCIVHLHILYLPPIQADGN